jgi:hypothetical protein
MQVPSPSGQPSLKRPNLVSAYRIAAILMVAIVLVQAFLAGRGWFDDHEYFDLHEIVSNLIFLNALALLGLAIAIGAPAAWRNVFLAPHVLLLVLVVAQIALGYSLRDGSAEAGAWHIPNGVLIFGLSVFLLSLLPRLREASSGA